MLKHPPVSPNESLRKKGSEALAADLEVHARFDLLGKHFGDGLVKGGDDFHGGLGFNAAGMDQVVESVNE